MARWLQQLREAGSPGCHLLTLVENTRALKFFEKSGFRNHGNPALVGGMRGKKGERLHQQIMVRNPCRLVPARVAATLAEEAALLLG